MPRKYNIDCHDEKSQIIEWILKEIPYREITRRFGVGRGAIFRYANNELAKQLQKAKEKGLDIDSDKLKGMVLGLIDEIKEFIKAAKQDIEERKPFEARREAAHYVEIWRRLIETLAKLLGQIDGGTTINIINNPIWIQVYQKIMGAVEDPKVREKIASALDNIEEPGKIDSGI